MDNSIVYLCASNITTNLSKEMHELQMKEMEQACHEAHQQVMIDFFLSQLEKEDEIQDTIPN